MQQSLKHILKDKQTLEKAKEESPMKQKVKEMELPAINF